MTDQENTVNLLKRLKDAAPVAVMHEPSVDVAVTRAAAVSETQKKYIEEKTQRLTKDIEKYAGQIAELRQEEDAELVSIRASQAYLDDQRKKTLGKRQQLVQRQQNQAAELEEARKKVQELTEAQESTLLALGNFDAEIAEVNGRFEKTFQQEKGIYDKRAKQIDYLTKKLEKLQGRLGRHKMRTGT